MKPMNDRVSEWARIVWDYHRLQQPLQVSDVIFVLGSHDLRVAERAVELNRDGMAPLILMSGGYGNFTQGIFEKPEADLFAEVAYSMGVARDQVLIENLSTNTGENVVFTRRILEERGLVVRSVLAVQKPYMERRTFATIRKQWPEVSVCVTSPLLSFDEYCSAEFPLETVIPIMVGDLHRILTYPAKGFQIPQHVPEHVMAAYQHLIEEGYGQHLG